MDTPERTMESEANEPRPVDPPPEGANQDEALTSSEKRLLLGLAVAGKYGGWGCSARQGYDRNCSS